MSHPYNENRHRYKSRLDPLQGESGMVTRKHKLYTVYVRGADISKRVRCIHCNHKIADGNMCSENGDPCLAERQAKLKKWEATAR